MHSYVSPSESKPWSANEKIKQEAQGNHISGLFVLYFFLCVCMCVLLLLLFFWFLYTI